MKDDQKKKDYNFQKLLVVIVLVVCLLILTAYLTKP